MNETLAKISRLNLAGLASAILGVIFCCLGFIFQRREFYVSYLFAFAFWTSLSLGCFYLAMIHYLTAGRWGFPARRVLEAGYMTLPLMMVLFVPLFFGLKELYPWARPVMMATDKIVRHKSDFESPALYMARGLTFFAIWVFIAWLIRKWSLRQDTTTDVEPMIKIRTLSGPALAIVPLTASFAFVDWAMSIEADWFSTDFPVIILAGQTLVAIAFAIVVLAWARNDPVFGAFAEKPFHDLGSLLLAFVLFWTYVAFAQILITYAGNLPHEIVWYLHRIGHSWIWLAGFIALFHFFLPFMILLFRRVKTNVPALAIVAWLVFSVHAVEMFWVIAPTFYPKILVHWTDFAAWFGIGGLWIMIFCGNFRRHPLLARNDPRAENPMLEAANAR